MRAEDGGGRLDTDICVDLTGPKFICIQWFEVMESLDDIKRRSGLLGVKGGVDQQARVSLDWLLDIGSGRYLGQCVW